MFRKSLITFLSISAVLLAGAILVSAQSLPVSGKVELQKADGTKEPVANALVEVYRIDIKAGFPSTKTNKKGEFSFAGMQLGATYTFSVSAPDCAPTVFPNVKAGMERISIILEPGDGRKYSEADVRKGVAEAKSAEDAPAELTADQKKAQAEYEAQKKATEEKNKKIEATNEIKTRSLSEGNEAFSAKNYDVAVAKFDEGYNADPTFIGSAPIFLNNKSITLTARGVDSYNKAVKAADASEKFTLLNSAKKDFADASDGFLKAWNLLKEGSPADANGRTAYESNKVSTLRGAKDTFYKAVRTEQVDDPTIEAAKVLIPEYLNIETESAKKAEASLLMADLYRVKGDSVNAIAAYKKILETSPDDVDALAGAGLSLVNLGFINSDKAMLQEGANFLQKFAGLAPDTHKYKPDALALIDMMKKEQNIAPQKIPTTKKKP